MSTPVSKLPGVTAKRVILRVVIKATRERVWQALIEEPNQWWRKDFFVYENAILKLEAWPGGRLFEETRDGAGGIWYTVMNILPPASVELSGHLAPRWGGPATSIVRFSLTEQDNQTVVEIDDALYGCLRDNADGQIRDGWRMLFEQGLKPYIEAPAPTIA